MKGNMNPGSPLEFYIHVDKVVLDFPTQCLSVAGGNIPKRSISRILNSLQENNYTTISDVLNASLDDLGKARNFGGRGIDLLLSLLQTASEQPELILNTDQLEKSKLDVTQVNIKC